MKNLNKIFIILLLLYNIGKTSGMEIHNNTPEALTKSTFLHYLETGQNLEAKSFIDRVIRKNKITNTSVQKTLSELLALTVKKYLDSNENNLRLLEGIEILLNHEANLFISFNMPEYEEGYNQLNREKSLYIKARSRGDFTNYFTIFLYDIFNADQCCLLHVVMDNLHCTQLVELFIKTLKKRDQIKFLYQNHSLYLHNFFEEKPTFLELAKKSRTPGGRIVIDAIEEDIRKEEERRQSQILSKEKID